MKANPQIEIVRLAVAINEDLSQAIAYYELSAPSGICTEIPGRAVSVHYPIPT
jgi:hypothetical protein